MRLLLPVLLLLTACARTVAVAPSSPPTLGAEETGYASWYGHPYHGRRTASGEVYDMYELTAAHRTAPLGARLIVTNVDTGHAVEVRVNDRGPFVDGRILDLSYAAARVLGADRSGVIPVRVRVIDGGAAMTPRPGARPTAGFAVQVGAFAARARAESLRDTLARDGDVATISEADVGGDSFFQVRLGPYADRQTARAAAQRLAARGYRAVVVER